jgi:hypothetical protein
MKLFVIMMLSIVILNLRAYGSCLIRIDQGKEYYVSIWKHAEDETPDTVKRESYSECFFNPVLQTLKPHKTATFIFNNGALTSMRFEDLPVVYAKDLSVEEEELVQFVKKAFDVKEK